MPAEAGAKMRSMVWERMRFVVWSWPRSLPVRVRPSEVRIVTVSVCGGGRGG